MIVRKCDFKGCDKAGTCRCPKDRTLKEYWHFCQKHAAEYNKNWNYYAGMTTDEIERQWEKDVFGEHKKDHFDWRGTVFDFAAGRGAPRRRRAVPRLSLRTSGTRRSICPTTC